MLLDVMMARDTNVCSAASAVPSAVSCGVVLRETDGRTSEGVCVALLAIHTSGEREGRGTRQGRRQTTQGGRTAAGAEAEVHDGDGHHVEAVDEGLDQGIPAREEEVGDACRGVIRKGSVHTAGTAKARQGKSRQGTRLAPRRTHAPTPLLVEAKDEEELEAVGERHDDGGGDEDVAPVDAHQAEAVQRRACFFLFFCFFEYMCSLG